MTDTPPLYSYRGAFIKINTMQKVINFSGGKTSAFMTIQEYREGDIVIFCDTGREHPATYQFIKDFEIHEKIPIVWLKYEGGFSKLIEKRKAVPNTAKRFCTIELKVKTARRYLRSLGLIQYENLIGFRADEKERVFKRKSYWQKVTDRFPLYEKGITKEHVNEYWRRKQYTLEIPPILGNCTLCFMKGKNAIISILRDFPELADDWIKDEEQNGKFTYISGIKMKQLLQIANSNLFKGQKLEELNPAINCACTN